MELLLDRLIAVVLALTTFSIKANPKADGADVLLAHAVPEAEIIVAYDGKPIMDNYPRFLKLPDSPLFAHSPGAQQVIREAVTLAEQVRPMLKQQFGNEPLDYMGATQILFISPPAKPDDPPLIMYAARLEMTAVSIIQGFTKQGGKEVVIDGRTAIRTANGMLVGMTRDGTWLGGHEAWVRPRLADAWKAPPRPRGSALATVAAVLDTRPFVTIASMPSPATTARVRDELGQGFASDLYAGHRVAVLSLSATGASFTYEAHDPAFAARVKLATEGAIEVLRAFHLAPRSALQLAAAALPSYAGKHRVVDELLATRPSVFDALATMSGDGRFAAKVSLDGNRVSATARGKKVSEVIPANLLLGVVVLGVLSDDDDEPPAATPPPPPLPKRRPATGTGGNPAKRAR